MQVQLTTQESKVLRHNSYNKLMQNCILKISLVVNICDIALIQMKCQSLLSLVNYSPVAQRESHFIQSE